MASTKLFGCTINVDGGVDGGFSISNEVSRSGIQPDGEAMSLSDQRESGDYNPYFRFTESNPDSGSAYMDSGPVMLNCYIDFFDRESYQIERPSTSGDFGFWGLDDTEEEIELGLGIGIGSGSGSVNLGGEVASNGEIDPGVVEEAMVGDEEDEREDLLNAINWVEEAGSRDDDDEEVEVEVMQFLCSYNIAENIECDYVIMDIDYDVINSSIDEYNEGYYNGMFDEEEGGIIGSPPASKRVIDNLPIMEFTSEELKKGNIVCAICKDEVMVEEKVKKLPCKHYYHGECINPWLRIRNTCPVCRFELPTDDHDYEMRNSQRPDSC